MPHEPSHATETAAMMIAAKAVEAARLDERGRCAKVLTAHIEKYKRGGIGSGLKSIANLRDRILHPIEQ